MVTIFVSSFVLALSGALMPGSMLALTVVESTRKGPGAGLFIVAGHGLLEAALVCALALGLAPFLANKNFIACISFAGGLVLVWMAAGMFRSLPKLSLQYTMTSERKGNLVFSGIAVSIANPYWIVWWAVIGAGLVVQAGTAGVLGLVVFYIGHFLADFGWYAFVSLVAGKGRTLLNDTIYRCVIGVCAAVLAGFAVYFIFKAVPVLTHLLRA